jgi:hypothetical protein
MEESKPEVPALREVPRPKESPEAIRYKLGMAALTNGVRMTVQLEFSQIDIRHRPGKHVQQHMMHHRMGINSALLDSSALANALIAKGIITTQEYEEQLANAVEYEVAAFERQLSKAFGKKINLYPEEDPCKTSPS